MPTLIIPTRIFPGRGLGSLPRRGVGSWYEDVNAEVSGQPWYIPDLYYNLKGQSSPDQVLAEVSGQPLYIPDLYYNLKGQSSPDQVLAADAAANAAAAKATIDPVTGLPVAAAVQYAASTSGAAGTALQQAQAQPTGNVIADTFQSLLNGIFGTASTTPTSGAPWGTIAIIAVVGLGGYWVWKKL